MMLQEPSWSEVLARLGLTVLLSGLIGAEREAHDRPAGLRTHVLVGVGACLFMLLSLMVAVMGKKAGVNADPGRIAAQIVTGIGFLGAGTIFLRGDVVRGLTTAASIWATAAIGMAVGAGWYFPAVTAAAIVFVVLTALRYVERAWFQRAQRYNAVLNCIFVDEPGVLNELLTMLTDLRVHVTAIRFQNTESPSLKQIELSLSVPGQYKPEDITQILQRLPRLHAIECH